MKCEWCGKNESSLEVYTDAIGENHSICDDCMKLVNDCECRKCGAPTDPNMMINGLCTTCVQLYFREKSKKKEEARMGMDMELLNSLTEEVTLTDKDYESWLTLDKTFSPDDMRNSKELRRIWIMVKFNAAGIYEGDTISKNLPDIEELLDRNFSKLIGNKCRLLIGDTADARKVIRQSTVIDYENEVYILQA